MKEDIIVAGFIIAASIFFFVLTLQIEGVAGYEKMGPAFWPRFNLIGMIILSGVIRSHYTAVFKKDGKAR
jgi:hypothetical protein